MPGQAVRTFSKPCAVMHTKNVSDYLESLSYEIELTEVQINDWLWFECEDWLHEECGMNLDGSTYFEDED